MLRHGMRVARARCATSAGVRPSLRWMSVQHSMTCPASPSNVTSPTMAALLWKKTHVHGASAARAEQWMPVAMEVPPPPCLTVDPLLMSNIVEKRRRKMRRHKYRKHRRKQRFLRRKLGK